MASATEVLREYLLKLGFQVDYQQTKRFDQTIGGIGKTANFASLKVAGLATAVAGMAQVYANAMTKLYYSARHTNSTVQSLSALSYAGERVGISAARTQAGVEGVAKAMRDAGKLGFMETLLRRKVGQDEDPAKLLTELSKAINALPLGQSNKEIMADRVGIDSELLLDMRNNVKELDAGIDEFNSRTGVAGVDLEKVAAAAREWNNALIEVRSTIGTLEGVIAMKLLGPMHRASDMTHEILVGLIKDVQEASGFVDFVQKALWSTSGTLAGKPPSSDPNVGGWGAAAPDGGWFGDPDTKIKDWLLSFSNGGKGPARDTRTAATTGGSASYIPMNELGKGLSFRKEKDAIGAGQMSASENARDAALDATQENVDSLAREINKTDKIKDPIERAKRRAILEEELDKAQSYQGPSYASFGPLIGSDAETARRGGGAGAGGVNINQSNSITIHSDDAQAVRAGVESGLATSNGNLVRDLTGATR